MVKVVGFAFRRSIIVDEKYAPGYRGSGTEFCKLEQDAADNCHGNGDAVDEG